MVDILCADDRRVKRQRLTKHDLNEIFVGTVEGRAYWTDGFYAESGPPPANSALHPSGKTFNYASIRNLTCVHTGRWRHATPGPYYDDHGIVCVALCDRQRRPIVALQARYLHRARKGIKAPRYRVLGNGAARPVAVYDGEALRAVIMPLANHSLDALIEAYGTEGSGTP